MDVSNMRRNYESGELDEGSAAADPLEQFDRWLNEAVAAQMPEPNAMTLATVGDGGRPSARIVLLKDYDERGLVFFTNYDSRKGRELAANPNAALLFHWVDMERQVRFEGQVSKVPAAESDHYFAKRPLGSRIGAIASPQSQVIASRSVIAEAEKAASERFGDNPPRPEHWGGYVLTPSVVEFWQGRPSRLHDRLRYSREGDGWRRDRLAP
ncbi:pyridoxamine 5'-phosphate oxidase [Nigerium massiliense]|uniref:pyridoxamine 5'-phosphate oxidase n=1 Tax=Nigerium massiliense TaxID=1522317 RepID=UPI000693357B|nr:pyridoxamine 5'-phosphate oxidase [Nigerium massiliense]